jgi:dihydroxy-acid dehydratase
MELNKYSKTITQDETQPAAQAMLYRIGLTEDDLKKAQVELLVWVTKVIHVICT